MLLGSPGTNYNETQYGYDAIGRQVSTISPAGTITWNVLDINGDVLSTWVGTNDTNGTFGDPSDGGASPNNMVDVADYTYDPDGDVTSVTQHTASGGADVPQRTSYVYNWQDEQIEAVSPADAQARVPTLTTNMTTLAKSSRRRRSWPPIRAI